VAQTTCSRFFEFLELSPFLGIFDFRKTPWTRISTSTVDDLGQFLPTIYQHSDPGTFNPGRYVIGKLDSICYSALVFIVSQFLRKMEWRFCEKSRRRLGLAWEKCRVQRGQKSTTRQPRGQRYPPGCGFYIVSTLLVHSLSRTMAPKALKCGSYTAIKAAWFVMLRA